MKKTYHIIFTRDGRQVEMKLREWARENLHYFPNYGFTNSQDDHPTTHQIRDFCERHLNGRIDENERRVVIYI
jgi:hypothetical protein